MFLSMSNVEKGNNAGTPFVSVSQQGDIGGLDSEFINIEEVIQHFHQVVPESSQRGLTRLDAGETCFVMGRNDQALSVMQTLKVEAVIDDFYTDMDSWCGKNVISSADVPDGAIVINCSTAISPLSAAKKIQSIDMADCLSYADLCRSAYPELPLPVFVEEARRSLVRNESLFRWIYDVLHDSESRTVFNDVMRYRLTGDPAYMRAFSVRMQDQYFEDFWGDLSGCVFVDAGGFTGDTVESFIRHCPDYDRILLFEPSEANITKAKERLAGKKGIEYIRAGLSDQCGELCFDPGLGSASKISREGEIRIQVVSLDEYVRFPVSFIKMDIEGWELKALQGARNHIIHDKPIMAIAVYHTIDDFWKIPRYILSLMKGYRVYLRHYTEGWSETIMYFVPAS